MDALKSEIKKQYKITINQSLNHVETSLSKIQQKYPDHLNQQLSDEIYNIFQKKLKKYRNSATEDLSTVDTLLNSIECLKNNDGDKENLVVNDRDFKKIERGFGVVNQKIRVGVRETIEEKQPNNQDRILEFERKMAENFSKL